MATNPTDDWMRNPIFGGGDPIPRLISSARPTQQSEQPKKRAVPPAIGRIIGELGLRYRPAAAADLEAHAHTLRLLCEDVADVPPHLLEDAAKRWVRENKFMPKASELVALARGQLSTEIAGTDAGFQRLQDHCDRLNQMNGGRDGWHVYGEVGSRSIRRRDEAPRVA